MSRRPKPAGSWETAGVQSATMTLNRAVGAKAALLLTEHRGSLTSSAPEWTADEVEVLRSLWLETLPALPPDPSNAVADNPIAAEFGRQLFFDTRLSSNGSISCATCHQAERRFTDGLQKAQAIGTTERHTPSIVGSAYSPWQFWDGRRDSQWAQALAQKTTGNVTTVDGGNIAAALR